MIFTNHSLKRILDRILMPVVSLQFLLEDALRNKDYSFKAPSWYYGNGHSDLYMDSCWICFKDLDGIRCAALIDREDRKVITVVKNA